MDETSGKFSPLDDERGGSLKVKEKLFHLSAQLLGQRRCCMCVFYSTFFFFLLSRVDLGRRTGFEDEYVCADFFTRLELF